MSVVAEDFSLVGTLVKLDFPRLKLSITLDNYREIVLYFIEFYRNYKTQFELKEKLTRKIKNVFVEQYCV